MRQFTKPVLVLAFLAALGLAIPAAIAQVGIEALPDHLKLRAAPGEILGTVEREGVVKYAYNSRVPIATRADELLELRTPHARTFRTDKSNSFVTEIVSGVPQYYKDEQGRWWQAEYATTTPEAFDLQTKPGPLARIGALLVQTANAVTDTFYPDGASVDGNAARTGASESWSSIRTGSGTDSKDSFDPHEAAGAVAHSTTDNFQLLRRGIYVFDTSSIPDTNQIDSATFSVYGFNSDNSLGNLALSLVGSTPSSTTSLIPDDYGQVGTTRYASDIPFGSLTTSGYNTFTLNATGLAALDKTGLTRLGTAFANDIDNSAPTWTSSGQTFLDVNFSEHTGTSQDPKLTVTHSGITTEDNIHAFFSSDAALTADRFMGPQQLCTTGSRVDCEVVMPQDVTVRGMSCFIEVGTSGKNATFTLYDDGSPTSITCSANGVQKCVISAQSVAIVEGSMITVLADETLGAINGHAACTVFYKVD